MPEQTKIKLLGLFLIFLLTSFNSREKLIKVYLIGDSTISIKEVSKYPEKGWGMPFAWFFDSGIKVDNRAMNGRSTKSFISEKRWDAVKDSLKAGDYVFIQFGHNDEVPTKKSYTTETEFVANLSRFVEESRKRNAIPVLITPVARRLFNEDGKVQDSHKEYAQLVRNTATKLDVPLIDLSEKSMALLQELGVEKSKYLFNHLKPGQNPNYPKGLEDNTHFNELGARYMAELVLADIKKLNLSLREHIVQPEVKKQQ